MFRKWWWKITGLFLVLGSLFAGLLIPLSPGIYTRNLPILKSGIYGEIVLFGQNADLKALKHSGNVFLKNGSYCVKASVLRDSMGMLLAGFRLPAISDTTELHLIGADLSNGYMEFDNGAAILHPSESVDSTAMDTVPKALAELKASGLHFPNRVVLEESVRNLLFHVPMWFSLIFLLGMSWFYSIKYLRNPNKDHDLRADVSARTAMLAGVLGCVTGAAWARVTWGSYWPDDPKLNGVAVGMLIYFGYLFLRATLPDPDKRARLSAVYNVFVYPVFIALIVIMPKLSQYSLHPGSGDTVTVKSYDLDNTLRLFFYPAVVGWIFIYLWMAELLLRMRKLRN